MKQSSLSLLLLLCPVTVGTFLSVMDPAPVARTSLSANDLKRLNDPAVPLDQKQKILEPVTRSSEKDVKDLEQTANDLHRRANEHAELIRKLKSERGLGT